MEVEVSQLESVLAVNFLQHIRSVVGHKEAEARREVVGSSDLVRKFVKFNIFAVVWEDAYPETTKKFQRMDNSRNGDSRKTHRDLPSRLVRGTSIDYHPPSERHTQATFLPPLAFLRE